MTPETPNTVIIVRGLPGAGKTDFLNYLLPHVHISRDPFWTGPHIGQEMGTTDYDYDDDRSDEATAWAMERYLTAMRAGHQLIVVDNTHVTFNSVKLWADPAHGLGYRVKVVHVERSLKTCFNEQTHGVPYASMWSMFDQWELLM